MVVGSNSGQLAMIDPQEGVPVYFSFRHEQYVADIKLDEQGRLWTLGGDGRICVISREDLAECWRSRRHQ